MALPHEKLAQSLEVLKHLQDKGLVAIRTRDLSRTHRERLMKNGFLQQVTKGWYIATHPEDQLGDTTPWYSSFWRFCADYLNERFGDQWCLYPEQSISLHVGNHTVPRQLIVKALKGNNKPTTFLHGTSLLDMKLALPDAENITLDDNLRIYKLPSALIEATPNFYVHNPTDARAALSTFKDASPLLSKLLDGGHSTVAGRLCGAFRNIGHHRIADEIKKTMESAGYDIREVDPFKNRPRADFSGLLVSPYAARIRIMWQEMRAAVIEHFPTSQGIASDTDAYLHHIDDVYATDAYHSLSIEGYRVTPGLIQRVRTGEWNPEDDEEDRRQRDALTARGYYQAFQAVKKSVQVVLGGKNAGVVARKDHGECYREMFAPLVTAGIMSAGGLAGYRDGPVFIRGSRHVPISGTAVSDVMSELFQLLEEEVNPAVRVVLGHFVFVYIHPYGDGNGRTGRFLMNLMLASGGYPWTVIPVQQRGEYMHALEEASVRQDIVPFAKFLSYLVKSGLRGQDVARLPTDGF